MHFKFAIAYMLLKLLHFYEIWIKQWKLNITYINKCILHTFIFDEFEYFTSKPTVLWNTKFYQYKLPLTKTETPWKPPKRKHELNWYINLINCHTTQLGVVWVLYASTQFRYMLNHLKPQRPNRIVWKRKF